MPALLRVWGYVQCGTAREGGGMLTSLMLQRVDRLDRGEVVM